MNKQAKIISFANHKGGVGKTTTTASVGAILSSMGKRVLLVDMDAQNNLTTSLLKNDQVENTIYEALSASCRGTAYNLGVYPISDKLDMVIARYEESHGQIRPRKAVKGDVSSIFR